MRHCPPRPGTDRQGRAYLTFEQAKAGRAVTFDGDFTCVRKGAVRKLRKSPKGLWFHCTGCTHLIEAQIDFDGGRFYVGLYPVAEAG